MKISTQRTAVFNSKILARDLAQLMFRNFQSAPLHREFSPSLKVLKKYTLACIEVSMRKGICEPFYIEGKLRAFLVVLNVELAPGLPIYWGFAETDQSKCGDQWLLRKLAEHQSFIGENAMIDLPHYIKKHLSKLYQMGFFIDTVRTVGTPSEAYSRLMELRNPADHLPGVYSLKRVTGRAELKEIQKIEKAEFERNPQYGWFVASDAWLKQSLERRLSQINDPESCLYVIKKKSQVLGYFAFSPQPGLTGGKTVGSEFSFHRSIQGKGFSTIGYRILLEQMLKNNVKYFVGNTSQKPTLKLAKTLGRVCQAYSVRVGKGAFPAKYFQY